MANLFLLVVFIEAFLHYFRWREILSGRELPRPVAYILGVLGLMLPFSGWLWQRNDLQTLIMLWLVIGAGGASVLMCYGTDAIIELYWGKRHAEQREQQLKEKTDAKTEGS